MYDAIKDLTKNLHKPPVVSENCFDASAAVDGAVVVAAVVATVDVNVSETVEAALPK